MPRLPTALSIRRRAIMARLLGLTPPRHAVDVERAIPVAMADGVRLLTDHYAPRDAGDCPTILIRTPYGRGREVALGGGYALGELPAQRFAERGYHVVVQGTRGCYDSEGTFTPHVNEAADGRATADWIARQPWFNASALARRLAVWGPSYLGYTGWATAVGAGPHLSAVLLMVTSAENYTVTHPDGAFGLETRLRWAQGIATQARLHRRGLGHNLAHRLFGRDERKLQAAFGHVPLGEADAVAAGEPIPFFREMLDHTEPDDAYWTARDHREGVARVEAPVHLVGGWYDYYLRGLLRDYAALQAAGRRTGQRPHLTLGPWTHGSPEGLLAGLREGLAWFEIHLKGDGSSGRAKPVRLYLMGADEWIEMDDFPPPSRPTHYYLQGEGGLATEPPPESPPEGYSGPPEGYSGPPEGYSGSADRYTYDPADPTPAVGGALLGFKGAGAQDNGPLEARADVVCYTTPPLAEDLDVVGPVRLVLFVRSSRAHTDFFGRLCDVSPEGTSTNVNDGLFRLAPGRGGSGPDGAQPDGAQPSGAVRIEIDLWPTAHRFRAGHRLRLQVSSGAHPRWSRNLGYGDPLLTADRLAPAEQTIYHDAAYPSALILPVVETLP